MYCSSMWLDSTVTSMKNIAYINGSWRLQNLPKHNSPSEMFVNLNIPSLGRYCENLFLVLCTDLLTRTIP